MSFRTGLIRYMQKTLSRLQFGLRVGGGPKLNLGISHGLF
jgi:hypothetical protein